MDIRLAGSVAPKQGGRAARRDGRIVWYQPAAVRRNAAELAAALRPCVPREPIRTAVRVEYEIGRRRRPEYRPDLGNLEKQLDDVLMRAGILADDAVIVERESRKVYTESDRLHIRVLVPHDAEPR